MRLVASGRGPIEVTPEDPGQRRAVEAARRAPVIERPPAPATSCPLPSKVPSSGYDLAKLAVFSKTL